MCERKLVRPCGACAGVMPAPSRVALAAFVLSSRADHVSVTAAGTVLGGGGALPLQLDKNWKLLRKSCLSLLGPRVLPHHASVGRAVVRGALCTRRGTLMPARATLTFTGKGAAARPDCMRT